MATKFASPARAIARAGTFVAMLGLVLAGCASGTTNSSLKAGPGVDTSAKTISLGILTPLTGPVAAPIGIPLTNGIATYFDYVNDNGGITVGSDHYKIKLVQEDSKYDVATQVQDYTAIHNQVLMIAESLGTPTTVAIQQQAAADQMLVAAATLDAGLARQTYMVMLGTPYRLQVENAIDYVVHQLGDTTSPIGFMYQNDEYGQDAQVGYNEAKAFYKFTDAGQQPFTYNSAPAAYVAPLSALAGAHAKYVFLTATPGDAANIVGTAAQLNYFPQWIWQSPCYASALLGVPALVPLLEHFVWVVAQGAAWGDTTKPGMALLVKNVAKYMPSQQPDGYFEFGYAEAIITTAILQKAAANGDLTRAGLLAAFNSLTDVDLGQIFPDAHYGPTPNQRVPTRDSIIYAIDHTSPGGTKPITNDFEGGAAAASQF